MEIIQFLQQFDHPAIIILMKVFTFLGNEPFYILILPVLFWCWDKQKAFPLVLIIFSGYYINEGLKMAFHLPRPEGVAMIDAVGYGFPSGHAHNAVVFWGYMAWVIGKNYWLAGVMAFFIGLSRIYLGVHFPMDVVGGWSIGFVWLFISIVVLNSLKQREISIPALPTVGLALVISLWLAILYPNDLSIKIAGATFGLIGGVLLERSHVGFSPKTSYLRQGLKFLLGLLGIIMVKEGIKFLLPEGGIFDYPRYVLLGFWVTFLAPWMFVKTGLSVKSQP